MIERTKHNKGNFIIANLLSAFWIYLVLVCICTLCMYLHLIIPVGVFSSAVILVSVVASEFIEVIGTANWVV